MTALDLLQHAPAEWRALTEPLDREAAARIEAELSMIAQRAALLASYVGHRFNSGCGPHDHADGAKVAGRALVKVRRAMGYSYPQNLPIRIA